MISRCTQLSASIRSRATRLSCHTIAHRPPSASPWREPSSASPSSGPPRSLSQALPGPLLVIHVRSAPHHLPVRHVLMPTTRHQCRLFAIVLVAQVRRASLMARHTNRGACSKGTAAPLPSCTSPIAWPSAGLVTRELMLQRIGMEKTNTDGWSRSNRSDPRVAVAADPA